MNRRERIPKQYPPIDASNVPLVGKTPEIKLPDKPPPNWFTPTGCMVALYVLRGTEITSGGIHIPETAKGYESMIARCIAAGPDCKHVKEGSIVVVANGADATVIRLKEHTWLITREEYCAGVMNDDGIEAMVAKPADKA